MDATERLLIAEGHARISTRRVAEEADQPHGLIRYHFGSVEELMLRTVERAAAQILDRQRSLYASDRPFIEKWRTAMDLVDIDLATGFPKVTAELFAKAWNDPAFREGLRQTMEQFTEMLVFAVTAAASEYEIDLSAERRVAAATLIRTFQLGLLVERLADIDVGHRELLSAIDGWLASISKGDDHAGAPA